MHDSDYRGKQTNPSLWNDGKQEFILVQTKSKIKLAAPTIPLVTH